MTILYPIFKSLHIVFVVAWFAALFYLPRLFIYQTEARDMAEPARSTLTSQYKLMASRLLFIIAWPAAILTIIFGLGMAHIHWAYTWFWIKMALVAGLFIYHHVLHFTYKGLKKDKYKYSSQQLRVLNEVATVFLFAIVFITVLKSGVNYIIFAVGLAALIVLLYLGIKAYRKNRKNREIHNP
jgi:putative membrane protein